MACAECGYQTKTPAEFHPFAFCIWVKAGLDPWATFRDVNQMYADGKYGRHLADTVSR